MYKRIGYLLLALAILVSAFGFSARPAYAATCTRWYTVRPGNTLSSIGAAFGVSWTYLAKINHITYPYTIYSGQVICVSTTGSGTTTPVVTSFPYFFIQSVSRNNTVTIKGYNFPLKTKFNVLMAPRGNQAIGGIFVTSFNTGNSHTFVKTFAIPAQLYGVKQIAIRTQGSVYFAYNWFYNNTATVHVP